MKHTARVRKKQRKRLSICIGENAQSDALFGKRERYALTLRLISHPYLSPLKTFIYRTFRGMGERVRDKNE